MVENKETKRRRIQSKAKGPGSMGDVP